MLGNNSCGLFARPSQWSQTVLGQGPDVAVG